MHIHKNPIWLCFLVLLLVPTLWNFGQAVHKINVYFSLDLPTRAFVTWNIKELNSDTYVPYGVYHYEVDGKKYEGSYTLQTRKYLNAQALEQDLPIYQEKRWIAWYNSQSPGQSSLEKQFPFKTCVYASVLVGIFLYFLCIGHYVAKQRGQRE
jgi:hypothetical protein